MKLTNLILFTAIFALMAAFLVCAWQNWKRTFPTQQRRNYRVRTFLFAQYLAVPWLKSGSLFSSVWHRPGSVNRIALANIAEGSQATPTYYTDAAIGRYLLLKKGSDVRHVALCGAANRPIGNSEDESDAAEKTLSVRPFATSSETQLVVASEAIAADVDVYTAASGKVQDEPAVAGTYWKVGRSRRAAAADGDPFEIYPCDPLKLIVVAAFTSTDGTAAAAADLAALKVEAEKIGDDVRALGTALATPALVKVLA